MTKLSEQTWKVISAFQKYIKGDDSEVNEFDISQIRRADEELGWRDEGSGFRRAMKNRIDQLQRESEKNEDRKEQSHIRAWQLVTGIIAGLLIAGLAAWLF